VFAPKSTARCFADFLVEIFVSDVLSSASQMVRGGGTRGGTGRKN
jgi:hypothetical protein